MVAGPSHRSQTPSPSLSCRRAEGSRTHDLKSLYRAYFLLTLTFSLTLVILGSLGAILALGLVITRMLDALCLGATLLRQSSNTIPRLIFVFALLFRLPNPIPFFAAATRLSSRCSRELGSRLERSSAHSVALMRRSSYSSGWSGRGA